MLRKIQFGGRRTKVHDTWIDFLDDRITASLEEIQVNIGNNFTPSAEKVLRFLSFDLSKLKVAILGQDPYPQPGVATGRAFEVGNVREWSDLKKNTSLQNILKLIYKNSSENDNVSSIKEIRCAISSNDFRIAPPNELFKNWEEQGVLLLNTSLTCELGKPNSHSKHWEGFSQKVIDYVKNRAPGAVWLLWGNDAKRFTGSIEKDNKFQSHHPRLNSKGKDSFFGENHFALDLGVDWLGKS